MKQSVVFFLFAIIFCCPFAVQAQDFNSGSGFMTTGSAYSSTITSVGASQVSNVDAAAANQGIANRGRGDAVYDEFGNLVEVGEGDIKSPIGSPAVLLLFAAAAAGVIALRRCKKA